MESILDTYPIADEPSQSSKMLRKLLKMLAMYIVLTLVTFTVARAASAVWLPSCSGGEALLEFPVYNARGLVIDTVTHCGKARSVCTLKGQTPKGPMYTCPALLRPR